MPCIIELLTVRPGSDRRASKFGSLIFIFVHARAGMHMTRTFAISFANCDLCRLPKELMQRMGHIASLFSTFSVVFFLDLRNCVLNSRSVIVWRDRYRTRRSRPECMHSPSIKKLLSRHDVHPYLIKHGPQILQ